jgi:hypothetical protein
MLSDVVPLITTGTDGYRVSSLIFLKFEGADMAGNADALVGTGRYR